MSGSRAYDVQRVGSSGEPVVVIDDFHPHPDHLRELAARSTFRTLGPHYPGVQAPADPGHLAPVQGVLMEVLRDVFGATATPAIVQCSFSLVTTPEGDLAPIQRLPHVDTTDPGRIALLHYLCGEAHGGTAFYRHRKTGLEVLSADNFDGYKTALASEGLPKLGYMRGTDARFEAIGEVAARPNRAVLYRSSLLHSGQIPVDLAFSADVAKGRLTLNTFIQH